MKEFIVEDAQKGCRIDKAICMIYEDISRASIQRLIENGKIFVNGQVVKKASFGVSLGDRVYIEEEQAKEIDLVPQDIPLEIVYEDKDIIVVNKSKGMVVHPANGNPDGTLVNAIMAKCKGSLSGIGGEIRPGIVHRIDKDTSRTSYDC